MVNAQEYVGTGGSAPPTPVELTYVCSFRGEFSIRFVLLRRVAERVREPPEGVVELQRCPARELNVQRESGIRQTQVH